MSTCGEQVFRVQNLGIWRIIMERTNKVNALFLLVIIICFLCQGCTKKENEVTNNNKMLKIYGKDSKTGTWKYLQHFR